MKRAERIASLHEYNCCPTCGQSLNSLTFRVDLNNNVLINGHRAVKVPPRYAELIWLLHKHYPNVVAHDTIMNRVWNDERVNTKLLQTTICLARAYIHSLGYEIVCDRGVGYRLVRK